MLDKRYAALLAAAIIAVTACGSNGNEDERSANSQSPDAASAESSTFPLTITNCGEDYTFTESPSRVVIMNGGSYAEVSSMLALGLGDRIVANAQELTLSDQPGLAEQVSDLPEGGVDLDDFGDIPREAMLGLRPDFVLSTWGGGFRAENGFATREELRAAGANTYVPESNCTGDGTPDEPQTVESSYALLRDLGRIFGVGDRAEELIAESERRIAAVAERVEGREPERVMFLIPDMTMGSGDFSSVGAHGIWTDIIERAGGENAFEDATDGLFANLSREQVAAAEVEALVVQTWRNEGWEEAEADAERLLDEFPQWPAAADRRYVALAESIYLGPNNAHAVEQIARLLHPEAF